MSKFRSGLLAAVMFGQILLAPVLAGPARAAADPAFWGYFHASGSGWTFAQTGPADAHPKDGDTEGWRFARSSGNTGTPPTDKPDFADVCRGTAAKPGGKRIAVVIDDGSAADAPSGQRPAPIKASCTVVASGATGADVLAAVAKPRTDKSGLVCAIDGFGPCGVASAPSPSARPGAAKKKNGGSGVYVGVGLVVLLAAAGALVAARRRRA